MRLSRCFVLPTITVMANLFELRLVQLSMSRTIRLLLWIAAPRSLQAVQHAFLTALLVVIMMLGLVVILVQVMMVPAMLEGEVLVLVAAAVPILLEIAGRYKSTIANETDVLACPCLHLSGII